MASAALVSVDKQLWASSKDLLIMDLRSKAAALPVSAVTKRVTDVRESRTPYLRDGTYPLHFYKLKHFYDAKRYQRLRQTAVIGGSVGIDGPDYYGDVLASTGAI